MNRHSYREELGRFRLMGKEEGSRYSGTSNERHGSASCLIPSVRIVEDGPVKRVVEAVMEYGHSQACTRYILPARGTKLRVEIRVNWAEKRRFPEMGNSCRFEGSDTVRRDSLWCDGAQKRRGRKGIPPLVWLL